MDISDLYKKNPIVWFHKRIEKSNKFCPYCGRYFGEDWKNISNKEHLIGRKFIPYIYSKENEDFNFIFRACAECNNLKSTLEGHVSSVSLYNCKERLEDENLDRIANNKGDKDFHPDFKGKKVNESQTKIEIKSEEKNFKMSARIIGPPQLNTDYANELAKMQLQGIFALMQNIEYKSEEDFTILLPSKIQIYRFYPETDWGNVQLKELTNRVKSWEVVAGINSYNGYFKMIIKKVI